MQEKAADRQSEIDELRAKRAFEQGERNVRAKEMAEREKQARVKLELEEARRKQFADRDNMLTQQAKAERDDFLRVVQRQKVEEENERKLN